MQINCPKCNRPLRVMDTLSQIETASYGLDQQDGNQTLKVNGIHCDKCGLIPFNFGDQEAQEPELKPPQSTIAHFRLIRALGRGGFGVVWLAEDISLNRRVALKTPGRSGDSVSMLLHEAQSAARLRHPNIVSVFETGQTADGQAFIASEYIEGLNLKDILSTGRPTQKTALELLVKITDAVAHAHDMGIIHRDLKPANIMIDTRGVPYVADFGLAKHVSADESISSEGQVLGTANYMSPEQATGQTRKTDHRADIYAIGVMLFEMLTGHLPFRGNTRAVIHQKTTQEAPSPRNLDPTIAKDLETICLKCLEREPEKRIASANLLREELERIQRGIPIVSRPIGSVEKAFRLTKRYPLVSGLSLGLLLSLTAGLIGVTSFWQEALRNADLAQRGVYRSQMALAAQHYVTGDIRGIQAALNRVSTEPELQRLHDFSWHYYERLIRQFETVVVHGDEVISVGLSNDGAFLATVGFDGHCSIWEVKSGEMLNRVKPEQDRFTAVCFSPNRFQLATGGSNGFCTIWNPNNLDVPLKSIKHGPPVSEVYFSPDGQLLMAHGTRGAVRIWDVQSEEIVAEIPSGPLGTRAAAFSPNGESIALGGDAGVLRVWHITSETNHWQVENSAELVPIEAISYSPDGTQIAVADGAGRYRVYSASDGELLFEKYTYQGRIGSIAYLKGSELLACTGTTSTLDIFDIQRGQKVASLPTHSLGQGCATISANGRYYAMGSDDGTAKVLGVDQLRQPQILWHASPVLHLSFSEDGQRFYSLGPHSEVLRHSLKDGRSEIIAAKSDVTSRDLSVDLSGQRLFLGVPSPQIMIAPLDPEEPIPDEKVTSIAIPKRSIAGIRFQSKSNSLIVIGRERTLLKYDANNPSNAVAEGSLPVESRVTAISSATNHQLAVGDEDGNVFVIANDMSIARQFDLSAVATAIDFCGQYLIVGLSNGNIELFDLQSQRSESVRMLEGHVAEITAIAHFPEQKTFASGSRDHRVKIWDITSGDPITTLYGHTRRVFCLAISPDGKTIVSGGLDGDIHLWKSTRD